MHDVLMFVMLALAYALADRFAGGGDPKLDDELPGRAAFWGCALVSVAGFLFASWAGALMGLAWFAWRTPPWKIVPGASTTPAGLDEIGATFGRHAFALVLAVLVAAVTHHDVLRVGVCFLLWTGFATGLAAAYGGWKLRVDDGENAGPDPNARIELARGAAFGFAVAAALV